MSQRCERHEHHQETAEAHRAVKLESHQRFIAKGKGRAWGPTVPSVAGPSNTVGEPRRSPPLPGAVRVMLSHRSSPPWPHLPTPITPPQSWSNLTINCVGATSEETVQEQGQHDTEHPVQTATVRDLEVDRLKVELDQANEEAADLKRQVQEKKEVITQLNGVLQEAQESWSLAIDTDVPEEVEKYKMRYQELRQLYKELEVEKKELEEELKRMEAHVAVLELELKERNSQLTMRDLELQVSQAKVESLEKRLRVKDDELDDIITTLRRTTSQPRTNDREQVNEAVAEQHEPSRKVSATQQRLPNEQLWKIFAGRRDLFHRDGKVAV